MLQLLLKWKNSSLLVYHWVVAPRKIGMQRKKISKYSNIDLFPVLISKGILLFEFIRFWFSLDNSRDLRIYWIEVKTSILVAPTTNGRTHNPPDDERKDTQPIRQRTDGHWTPTTNGWTRNPDEGFGEAIHGRWHKAPISRLQPSRFGSDKLLSTSGRARTATTVDSVSLPCCPSHCFGRPFPHLHSPLRSSVSADRFDRFWLFCP